MQFESAEEEEEEDAECQACYGIDSVVGINVHGAEKKEHEGNGEHEEPTPHAHPDYHQHHEGGDGNMTGGEGGGGSLACVVSPLYK